VGTCGQSHGLCPHRRRVLHLSTHHPPLDTFGDLIHVSFSLHPAHLYTRGVPIIYAITWAALLLRSFRLRRRPQAMTEIRGPTLAGLPLTFGTALREDTTEKRMVSTALRGNTSEKRMVSGVASSKQAT
jgi:hypothetical protein